MLFWKNVPCCSKPTIKYLYRIENQNQTNLKFVNNPNLGTMEVFSLTEDQIQGPIITVPCIDFGFIPTSKFLVVIHPAGLVYLYDGITQVCNARNIGTFL